MAVYCRELGVQFVVSDDHSGLKKAIREVVPEALCQRCYVHFLRSAMDYLPRKADDDCLMELRWIYDRRTGEEARQDYLHPRICFCCGRLPVQPGQRTRMPALFR